MATLKEKISRVQTQVDADPEKSQLLMELFPKVGEKVIPISFLKERYEIDSRLFFTWKESGLIGYNTEPGKEREWVKLNFFQFIWIRVCKAARDFGVPLETLRIAHFTFFSDTADVFQVDNPVFINHLRNEAKLSEKEIREYIIEIKEQRAQRKTLGKADKVFYSIWGAFLSSCLLTNDPVQIAFFKKDNYDFRLISPGAEKHINHIGDIFSYPILIIPVWKFIEDFFAEKETTKFLGHFAFLNPLEQRVVNAIESNEFKELTIKKKEKGKFKIEVVTDKEIHGTKAGEIKRLLSMKDYEDVNIKFRNNKHLYFENRTRFEI